MFRPSVDSVAGRLQRGQTRLLSAALAAMFLAPGGFATAVQSAEAAPVATGAEDVTIVAVELASAGAVFSQSQPSAGVDDHGHEPVDVVAVTVDDEGVRRLVPRYGAVGVSNLGYPMDLVGLAVSENGAQTPANTAGFGVAVERVFASSDLRDYVRSDELSQEATGWGHDYDVLFANPLDRSEHVLVQERNGNSTFNLLPLGSDGQPIPSAAAITVEPVYGWNTGIAPADQTPAQPIHLSVLAVEDMLGGTPATAVHGFRIDNDDEADIKLTALVPADAADAIIGISTVSLASPAQAVADHGVALVKSVYAGHNGGAGCPEAKTFTEAGPVDPVTYCFIVTNTGASSLANLVVSDPLSGVTPTLLSADSTPLAPGQSARYYIETTPPPDDADGFVDDTYINTATVSATPVDATGTPVADVEPVGATAEAVVFPAENIDSPEPQVSLVASVYAGVDGGIGCPAAKSTVVDLGADVTYCYTVTNTGNTHLDSIGLADSLVVGSPIFLRADSTPLAPGATAYYYLDSIAPPAAIDGFITASVVTANAVDATSADLVGLDDVTSNDGARVDSPSPVVPQGTPPAAVQAPPAAQTPAADPITATEAPTELAFTGWETWLIGALGIGLIALGWLLMHPDSAQRPAMAAPMRRRSTTSGE